MSVRATGRLVGELVKVTGMGNSPEMVVKSVDEKTKMATAFWFNNDGEYRENTFSVDVLDRAEAKKVPQAAKVVKGKKPAGKK